MTAWIIHCLAGGDVIGYRDENEDGGPLNESQAKRLAARENRKQQDRAEREGRRTCFEFIVRKIERTEKA